MLSVWPIPKFGHRVKMSKVKSSTVLDLAYICSVFSVGKEWLNHHPHKLGVLTTL